jgi:hypothetical protein
MATYTIEPVAGCDYEGRQWGYRVLLDGHPYMECSTGGTGPCWNFTLELEDEDAILEHVCDLDELIGALTALRDSDAHRENVERWK